MELPVEDLQLFGDIVTADETLHAMLCRDIDQPDELMLHWWDQANTREAARLSLEHLEGTRYKLHLRTYYRATETGSLYAPDLSEAEIALHRQFAATADIKVGSVDFVWSVAEQGVRTFTVGRLKQQGDVEVVNCETWNEFKHWASSARRDSQAVMFRGHASSKFHLCTTLTRVGRTRLERYIKTLDEFRGHCEAIFQQRFNPSDGHDFSTLLALAQHHGLPSPLLDFTASPYIAAYFAFSDALEKRFHEDPNARIRIYALTEAFQTAATLPSVGVAACRPYASTLGVSARFNPRLYAQQGQFVVTNVANLEAFLCSAEQHVNQRFILAVDIPASQAIHALEDLRYMGLSAASLFPGLDGVCRMMKQTMQFTTQGPPQPGLPSSSSTLQEMPTHPTSTGLL